VAHGVSLYAAQGSVSGARLIAIKQGVKYRGVLCWNGFVDKQEVKD
jgi:hypothetical protein